MNLVWKQPEHGWFFTYSNLIVQVTANTTFRSTKGAYCKNETREQNLNLTVPGYGFGARKLAIGKEKYPYVIPYTALVLTRSVI
jgi:hypothetical protein